jgi:uncharacterized protein
LAAKEDMTTREQAVQVIDNREASRYELTIDGVDAGFIDYRLSDSRIVLAYIEIDPSFGGQGFGQRLTQEALEDCRSRGLTVVPACPFIADYVRRHPELTTQEDGRRRPWFRAFRSQRRPEKR